MVGLTLALDAATSEGTVAVVRGGEVLAEAEVMMRGGGGSERLMPAVASALRGAGAVVSDIGRVVCGAGPGSFTSLRIAGSIGKGIAAGLGIPLLAVSSLLLIVAGSRWGRVPGRYLAVLDALRGEVYSAVVEVGWGRDEGGGGGRGGGRRPVVVRSGAVQLLRAAEAVRVGGEMGARLIGPGQGLDAHPHARGVAVLEEGAAAGSARACPVDVGRWEPGYGRLAEAQVRWEAAHGRQLPQD
jgi:tRNA threonylcarbamoyladenosine biosynthesis protein TsaB